MKILLTGHAGFIGSHLLERLLAKGHRVVGVDNFDPLYPASIKQENLRFARSIAQSDQLIEFNFDLSNENGFVDLKKEAVRNPFDAIIHLAAKAGVRPSIIDPVGYQKANVIATQNLLEFCRSEAIPHFVFAGSSSVYGINPNVPWKESDPELRPISPYASTKLSCELLGHVYRHLYGIRFLSLRFFTVFGPRQRPDLAIHKFTRMILDGEPIPVFGDGATRRDYTYIDDIIDGIYAALEYSNSQYEVINLGNDQTVPLSEMIETIENSLGQKAIIDSLPEQSGDVPQTWASIEKARELLSYHPKTKFSDGVAHFAEWIKKSTTL